MSSFDIKPVPPSTSGGILFHCVSTARALFSSVIACRDTSTQTNSFKEKESSKNGAASIKTAAARQAGRLARADNSLLQQMWQLLHLDTIHRAVPEKMSRTFSRTIGREREEAILNETAETIKGLFRDGGNVGGSIGILSGGKQAFLSIGTRDTSPSRLPPDDHTVYLISSMTKPILGLAMAVLVNDSRYNISFDTTVKEVLPRLERKSFLCHANCELTVGDLLDHNSEFLRTTNLWESPCGAVPWQTEDPIVSLLEHLSLNAKYSEPSSFVYGRNYSNECFALAAAIIERTTGMPWARFVKERVLQPLDMWFTFPDVTREEQQSQGNFAGTYSVRVDGTLRELREQIGEYKDLSYQTIYKYLEGWPHEPESIEVLPSQASRQTIMGAAAGIMSCVSDLLIFYKKFLAIYNLDEQTRKTAGNKLSEIERAMLTQQDYISRKATNLTCVYAGGWNITHIPWDPTTPGIRWPGADGDNARRLELAMTEGLGRDSVSAARAWPFFQQPSPSPSPGTTTDNIQNTTALYHGGNMTGATSFCLLHPSTNTAVVVLCNTRGYLLDAANLAGMLLADCLISSDPRTSTATSTPVSIDDSDTNRRCEAVRQVSRHIRAGYLTDVVHYEQELHDNWHDPLESASGRVVDFDTLWACVGRYRLCEGVFAGVQFCRSQHPADDENGDGDDRRVLWFCMYETGFKYPLRVKRDAPRPHDPKPNKGELTVTFAMPLKDLIPLGVGGTNRLAVEDFVLVFRKKDERERFGEFMWRFDRCGVPEGSGDVDMDELAWKRVE